MRAQLSRLSPTRRSASIEAHLHLGLRGFDEGWLLIAAAIKCCVGRKTRHRGSALSSGFVSEPGSLGRAPGSPRRAGSRSTSPRRRRTGPERRGHPVHRPQRGRPRGPARPCVTDGARRCPGRPPARWQDVFLLESRLFWVRPGHESSPRPLVRRRPRPLPSCLQRLPVATAAAGHRPRPCRGSGPAPGEPCSPSHGAAGCRRAVPCPLAASPFISPSAGSPCAWLLDFGHRRGRFSFTPRAAR